MYNVFDSYCAVWVAQSSLNMALRLAVGRMVALLKDLHHWTTTNRLAMGKMLASQFDNVIIFVKPEASTPGYMTAHSSRTISTIDQ